MRSAPSFCAPYLATADPIVGKCCPGVACSGPRGDRRSSLDGKWKEKRATRTRSASDGHAVTGWRSCVGQQVGGSVRSDQRATARGSVAAPLRPHMAHSRPRRDRPVPAAPSRYAAAESPAHASDSLAQRDAEPLIIAAIAAHVGMLLAPARVEFDDGVRVELDGAP